MWFMIVLLIALSMFSQMFLALIPGTTVAQNLLSYRPCREPYSKDAEICSPKYTFEGTLTELYSLLLGDWDLNNGLFDSSVYPLFVMFTFSITIIMLNMMIAIASDSYADAKQKGPKLFRVLRLNYCAEVIMIERVLVK